jgi:hypothetical protein
MNRWCHLTLTRRALTSSISEPGHSSGTPTPRSWSFGRRDFYTLNPSSYRGFGLLAPFSSTIGGLLSSSAVSLARDLGAARE